jgi:hypothetical protein
MAPGSPTSQNDGGKNKQTHRLPVPPLSISNSSFFPNKSTLASPISAPRNPTWTETHQVLDHDGRRGNWLVWYIWPMYMLTSTGMFFSTYEASNFHRTTQYTLSICLEFFKVVALRHILFWPSYFSAKSFCVWTSITSLVLFDIVSYSLRHKT